MGVPWLYIGTELGDGVISSECGWRSPWGNMPVIGNISIGTKEHE